MIAFTIVNYAAEDNGTVPNTLCCTHNACAYTVYPAQMQHLSGADAGRLLVTSSGPECGWQAATQAPWLSLATDSSEQADWVDYLVAANPGTEPRTASIDVACATVAVEQASGNLLAEEKPCASTAPDGTCAAVFEITASRDGGLTFGNAFSTYDRVEVYAKITLPPQHVGQVGELLALVFHDGKPWRKAPHLWVPAGADNITGMTAFADPKVLAETEAFQVVDGLIGVPGEFEVFVGYRLMGVVVFSPVSFMFSTN